MSGKFGVGFVDEGEPVRGELGEEGAFVGDAVGENDIVCGDAIRSDKEKSVFVDLENLSDFSTGDFLEADGVGIDARDDVGW